MDVSSRLDATASASIGGSGDRSLSGNPAHATIGHEAHQRQLDEVGTVWPGRLATLVGCGTAVPDQAIDQEHAARLATELGTTRKHARTLGHLYRRSGVKRRHSVVLEPASFGDSPGQAFYCLATDEAPRGPSTAARMQKYAEEATALAEAACRAAFDDAALHPREVTHLVTVSCSGFVSPGVDLGLMSNLQLAPSVERVHVGFMGCHGLLNGLRVARGLVRSDPESCVLLNAVELCSLHHQYTDNPQQLVANSLFSDGAAAALVRGTQNSTDCWRIVAQASVVIPETTEMMTWKIGDYGFEMSLSPQVPDVIERELEPWMAGWLASVGTSIEKIRGWAIHPGGPRILTATAAALRLSAEQLAPSQSILEAYGNMSSPTVMFILEQLRQSRESSPVVMLAFGPGLTVEAVLLER